MKHLYIYLYAFAVLFFSSCGKDSSCGGDDKDKVSGFPALNGGTFHTFNKSTVYLGATDVDGHDNIGPNARLFFITIVDSVCGLEPILISPTLGLLQADSTLTDSLRVRSPYGNPLDEGIPASATGKLYSINETYPFNENSYSATYTVTNYIYFRSHGSWDADSAYFFGTLLDSYGFQTSYKTNK